MRPAPPRLLLLGGGWTEGGGISNRTRLISREFAGRGWEVRAIGRAGGRRSFAVHREPGIVAVDLPGFGHPSFGGLLYLLMAPILALVWGRRARAALCLQLSTPLIAATMAGMVSRVPVLASTTSSGEFSEVAYLQRSRLAVARRRAASRASWLIGQTAAAADELRALTSDDRVAVVPTPVVLPPETAPLPRNSRVAFVGRLSEEKELPTLLAAWRDVVAERPTAHLELVGAGGNYRSVERQIRDLVRQDAVLRRTVTLHGQISHVRELLRDVDVFVLTSRTEGMSNALLEACAERRAVVATEIPGNVAVLGQDYPLYVRPGDVEELTAALVDVLSDPGLADTTAGLARSAAERHDVALVGDQLRALIDATTAGSAA